MTSDSLQLLKRLNPAVRPLSGDAVRVHSPFDSSGFDELLTLVSSGAVSSGRRVSDAAGLEPQLTDDEQQRLAGAADTAEAAGFATALLLIDGRGLVLDVSTRSVSAELSHTTSGSGALKLDGAVYVPGEGEGEETIREGDVVGPRLAVLPDVFATIQKDDAAA